MHHIFREIGVNVDAQGMQACHWLKEKDWPIVKFLNSKDSVNILRVKKNLLDTS